MGHKKNKKRSLSESDQTEKTVIPNAPVEIKKKKQKPENAMQNGAPPSKKVKKEPTNDVTKTNVEKKSLKHVKVEKKDRQTEGEKPKPAVKELKKKEKKVSQKLQNSTEMQQMVGKMGSKILKLSMDELKKKIQLIESRDNITKTGKRKLGIYKRYLRVMEEGKSVTKSETSSKKVSDSKSKGKLDPVQNVKGANKDVTVQKKQKQEKKKNKVENNELVKAQKKKPVDDDKDEDDDEEEEDTEDEDEDKDTKVPQGNILKTFKPENDNDEEEDEEEDEDSEEDDEDSDEKEDKKKKTPAQAPKKKRYVLFVGNIPYDTKVDDLKQHFLTKASAITDVRIPTDAKTKKPRGFAYVELPDQINYEKAYSLDKSLLNGRRINVQYTSNSTTPHKKAATVAKNMKLAALHKAGKLAGSKKPGKKQKPKKAQSNV